MNATMYDFTTVVKILKLRKERHELFYSNEPADVNKRKRISKTLYNLTGNEIYLRF